MSSQSYKARTLGIVGAGIAGLTLAIRLRQFGWPVCVFDARDERTLLTEGLFLTVAPPGMNGLRLLGLKEAVARAGMVTSSIELFDETGHALAHIDQSDHCEVFGSDSVTLPRGLLLRPFLERARQAGAELRLGTLIESVEPKRDAVALVTDDGESREFSLVAACDGLNSHTRRHVFPDYPKAIPSGLIGTGGFVDVPEVPETGGAMKMTFGRNAFLGYQKSGDGAVHWFSSYPLERGNQRPDDPREYADRLRRLHASDPQLNRSILAAIPGIERDYPIYNMPPLPTWHRGRIVLVGDAAHAVGPHAGLGASMAIEDGLVLADELLKNEDYEAAFSAYERRRKPRIEKVVAATERNGSQKRASNWFARMARRLILPLVIPLGARSMRGLFAYRIDQDLTEPAGERKNVS